MKQRNRRILQLVTISTAALLALSLYFIRPRTREIYQPGEPMEGLTRSLDREIPPDYPRVIFQEVSEKAGIRFRHFQGKRSTQLPEDMGSGAAWGDYDRDGDLDLFLVNWAGPLNAGGEPTPASEARHALYRNQGNGTFADVTASSGIDPTGYGLSASWADYDKDGYPDLFLTRYGSNLLYHNRRDGTFRDVTAQAGLNQARGFWAGSSWADYDRDGDLDLYVCGYVQYRFEAGAERKTTRQYQAEVPFSLNPSSFSPERNLLYRNNGNGTFTEVARQAGVENREGRSLSASWCDFDQDGWPDLYVANDVSDNAMFRNLGNGRFQDISHQAWVADYRGAMGLGIGDWDNDGDLDIFITHWIAQENALYTNLLKEFSSAGTPGGNFRFKDVADAFGLGQIALDYIGWGTAFLDYDNDGWLDLLVVNGSTFPSKADPSVLEPMRHLLFWNRGGDQGFYEVGAVSGDAFRQKTVGRGAAFADYDADGDTDALIMNHSGPPFLLRNDGGNRNGRLKVRLKGTRSNGLGIGARVTVSVAGKTRVAEMGAGSSYLSQNAPELVFGLGPASAPMDWVEVVWPSGLTQRIAAPGKNQTLVIEEGKSANVILAERVLDREAQQRFWQIYDQATQAQRQKRWRDATDLYGRALELNPQHEDGLYYRGNAFLELGDYASALEQWNRLLKVNPDSSRAHFQVGIVRSTLGAGPLYDLALAEQAFRQALHINKEETGALMRLGEVELARREWDAALRSFQSVLASNFRAVPAYYLSSFVHWKKGDRAAALRAYQAAVQYARPEQPVAGVRGEGDLPEKSAMPTWWEIEARRSLFRKFWVRLFEPGASVPDAGALDREFRGLERELSSFRTQARRR